MIRPIWGGPATATVLVAVAASALLLPAHPARGQLLFSFESDLEGWAATGFGDSDLIAVSTSTNGATEGLHSMEIETGPSFGWDVNMSVGPDDPTGVYDAFNTVAAELDRFSLDFDVSLTADSFSSVANPGNFFLINVAVNSDSPNFPQQFNVTPNLAGLTGTFPVSIPMTSLPVAQDSSFYQLNLGTNSDHQNGGGGEGAVYYVDNIRFTQAPEVIEETLFSWETPDNPATPEVNEQFEGWVPGFHDGHVHSLTSLGATDGATALQIDRQSRTSPNFSWGSQFLISSDTNPDPEIEDIDPATQAQIDDLVEKINGATAVAFDVRFDDAFPNTPSFTKFGVHFSDEDGTFYDSEGDSFNGAPLVGDTGTVRIPFSQMLDDNSGQTLDAAGLVAGTNFLRIGISTNTDGAGIYQIDNFRLISEVIESGDADDDGDVDGADFLVVQRTDPPRLNNWQQTYGQGIANSAARVAAVPEPAALLLSLLGCGTIFCRRGRATGSYEPHG